jgi:hypothetical protein
LRRLRQLEDANRQLKATVTDQALDIRALKDTGKKRLQAHSKAADGGGYEGVVEDLIAEQPSDSSQNGNDHRFGRADRCQSGPSQLRRHLDSLRERGHGHNRRSELLHGLDQALYDKWAKTQNPRRWDEHADKWHH